MSFEKLVKSNLYNWIGYGNINGRVWLIGVEEGGAEIWRNNTKTLEESLELRSKYEYAMDFKYVWEELYNIPLETFKGASVWNYMAAFLLSLDGIIPNTEKVKKFFAVEKRLGLKDSDHFLCELLPLPKKTGTLLNHTIQYGRA